MRHCVGKSCPALSSELGLYVANGSSRSRLCRTWLRIAGSSPVNGTFGGQETCDVFFQFQLSVPPAVLPHSRTKLPELWKPEAQARGRGTPQIPPAWLFAAPQAPSSPHCAALQPLAHASDFLAFRMIERPGGASSE